MLALPIQAPSSLHDTGTRVARGNHDKDKTTEENEEHRSGEFKNGDQVVFYQTGFIGSISHNLQYS